jgi:hypothetical protein
MARQQGQQAPPVPPAPDPEPAVDDVQRAQPAPIDGRITIEIQGDKPIHNGVELTHITLRKMKAKDLVSGDLVDGEARKSMAIFASMASVPLSVIEDLDIDDFNAIATRCASLMGKLAATAMGAAAEKD